MGGGAIICVVRKESETLEELRTETVYESSNDYTGLYIFTDAEGGEIVDWY